MPDPIIINGQKAQPIIVNTTQAKPVVLQQGPVTVVGTTLVPATANVLGGIIVGDNLTITANGRLSGTPGGVTSFNGRLGNVTLLANDVTSLANGVYLADTRAASVNTTYGNDLFYGLKYSLPSGDPTSFYAGRTLTGSTSLVSAQYGNYTASVELDPDNDFGGVRIRLNNTVVRLASTGFYAESGTANYSWANNTFLTQGRADSRYVTPANLTVYQLTATNTWANLTGKPTFATVATSGAYADLSGTPNLSLYLTTANAATTYLPQANFSFSNLTGKPTTLAGYGITDGLTSATAASTYATISSLSSYLTTSSAASTYLPSANFTYANITGKPTLATVATSGNYNDLSNKPASYSLPNATTSTLGGVIVGSGLSITNGTLSATGTTNIDGGSATTTGSGSYDGGSATTN